MKTEVYAWHLPLEVETDLEREARMRRVPVSAILDEAVQERLKRSGRNVAGEKAQRRLHTAAARCLGVLASGIPERAENAREAIRGRLGRRRAR